MGLFSFKKSVPASMPIPADILAAVNVNGEKAIAPQTSTPLPLQASEANSATISPFLKSKPVMATPEPPATLPIAEENAPILTSSAVEPTVEKAVQPPASQPFQNSPQSPLVKPIFPPVAAPEPELPPVPTPSFASENKSTPDFSQITQDKALLQKHKEQLAPLKTSPAAPVAKKSFFSVTTIISVVVFVLILGLISGGSWYYLNTRGGDESSEMSLEDMTEVVPPAPSKPAGSILVDQPNYLTLDIETITAAQIKAMLEQEAQKMRTEGVTTPVEYLVVDANNNPVAFSRFALLIGVDTSAELVNASLEPFSLYLVLDQGALRMALAVTLKAETAATFPANKGMVAESMKKFFYPEEYAGIRFADTVFSESVYKNTTIFYSNIDIARNFSFDLTKQEGILTFANSKGALRSVIDKRALIPEE